MFGDDGQRVGGWFLKHKLEGKRNRRGQKSCLLFFDEKIVFKLLYLDGVYGCDSTEEVT